MAFQLLTGESVQFGVRRLILEEISNIVHQLSNPSIEWDVGVHETRKSCKRIRAVLRLVRDEIGEKNFKQENIRFRDTARKLASVRDSWVKIEVLNRLTTSEVDKLPQGAFDTIKNRLIVGYEGILVSERGDKELIPGIIDTIEDAASRVENLPIKQEGFSAFERGLKRTFSRGRRGMKQSAENPIPENLHEWRKRVKYLWHQIEVISIIKPEELSTLAEELHELADILGDHHDLVVLQWTVQEQSDDIIDGRGKRKLRDIIDQRRSELEVEAERTGTRLYEQSPKDFCSVIGDCWQGWIDRG